MTRFSLSPFNHKTDRREIVYRHKETNASDTLYYDQFAPEYKEVWKSFLRDFETHLASRGWLSKTYLSFDESPHEVIESILDIVSDSAPVFLQQFSIAGRKEASSLAKSFSLFYSFLPEELAAGDEISTWLQERKKRPGQDNELLFVRRPCASEYVDLFSCYRGKDDTLVGSTLRTRRIFAVGI